MKKVWYCHKCFISLLIRKSKKSIIMKTNVSTELKRASKSRIAQQIRKAEDRDFNLTAYVVVSENAPSKNPKLQGWKEVPHKHYSEKSGQPIYGRNYPAIVYYYQEMGYVNIWIKTATLNGAARIWVK